MKGVHMAEKILILDDDEDIADILEIYLSNEGFDIYKYNKEKEALQIVNEVEFDLAILDIMMPEISGFDICKEIRKNHNYPIVMITAKEASIDKIKGFTLGADDYITKPFDPLEVVVRIKAQIRRYKKYNVNYSENSKDIFEYLGLVLNLKTHVCLLNGEEINLTPTEFKIIKTLLENKGKVVSSEELFAEIWNGEEYIEKNNTITVHVRNIRNKMGETVEEPKYIKTVWGIGYKID